MMSENEFYRNLVSSVVLVAGLWFLAYFVTEALDKRNGLSGEQRQRRNYYIRNVKLFLISTGLILIWGSELKSLALSLVAFAVAIIVATKELILCFLGGVLQTTSRPFTIGDRIEVGNFRGDVIDQNLLTTQLLEVGFGNFCQYTGREVCVPNSMFLSNTVVNETSHSRYVLHSFLLCFPRTADWLAIEKKILDKSMEITAPYKDSAEKALRNFSKKRSLDTPGLEPKVFVSLREADKIGLMVRLPVPAKDKGKIEQMIIRSLEV